MIATIRGAATLACRYLACRHLACALAWSLPAAAMVGGAQPASDGAGRAVVMLTGSHGTFCSGVALTRDLVLTAAHCVLPGADYKLVELDAARQPALKDIATIARHPEFDVNAVLRHRVTADVALIKLAAPLKIVPAPLAPPGGSVAAGDRFVVAGHGLAVRGDGRTGGTLRAATLVATGAPGALQIRLADPATKGERAGLGACTGDSGAPAFRDIGGALAVIGVVSWSTGPGNSEGCGGLTGVTPLTRYHGWIVEQAGKMRSPLQ
jgi:Trypsin